MIFSTNASTVLFAEETNLNFQDKSYINLITKCSSVSNNFQGWIHATRLSLNVEKTFSMLFSNKRVGTRPSLNFGTAKILKGNECNFLGIKINNN